MFKKLLILSYLHLVVKYKNANFQQSEMNQHFVSNDDPMTD